MRFVLFKVVSSFEESSEGLLNFLLSETTDWKGISDSQLMGYLAQLDTYRQSLESELDVLNERIVEDDQTASRIDSILANQQVADFDQQRQEQAKALVDKSSCLNERLGVQKRLVRCLDQISCIHGVRVERLEGFLRSSLGGMNQALLFQQEVIRGVRADQYRLFEGVRELCDSLERDKAALSRAWVSVRSELELIRSERSGRDGEIKALREVLEGQIAALKVEFLSVLNNRMNVLSQEEKIVEDVLEVVVSETFDELMESDLLLKDEFERLLLEILIDDLVRDFALEGFKAFEANMKWLAFYGGDSEKYGRRVQNVFSRMFG